MTAPPPVEDQRDRNRSESNLPVPDPTVQTTQLVDRALAAYREVVGARLDAMDRAVKLIADANDVRRHTHKRALAHIRDDRDRQSEALREVALAAVDKVSALADEKFTGIDTRFSERDTRTEQAAQESRISLDAALAAAKEAVSEQNKANTEAIRKSELATQKQIDSLIALMTTANKSVEDKISDLKSRQDRGEGQAHGGVAERQEHRLDIGQILLAASVVFAAIGIILTIFLNQGV